MKLDRDLVLAEFLDRLVTGEERGDERAHRGALLAAWTLTVMLAMFTVLAMMSIGPFVVPVTAALIVACATSRPQPPRNSQLSRRAAAK